MVYGILLAAIGAALLALGMNVQRYGMTTDPPVLFLKYKLPQFWVWLVGLLIYFAANGVYAFSLLFAPLSLIAGIFTTLLFWNLYIGKWLLKERLTSEKYWGALVVMLGVVLTVSSTSAEVPTEFSVEDIQNLFTNIVGGLYILFLIFLILVCVVLIVLFEKEYPLKITEMELDRESVHVSNELKVPETIRGFSETGTKATRKPGDKKAVQGQARYSTGKNKLLTVPECGSFSLANDKHLQKPLIRSLTTSFNIGDTQPISDFIRHFSSFYVTPREIQNQKNENVPYWIDRCMVVIYPGSLGLDEGVAHLSMKAFMSLFAQCATTDTCGAPILWLMVLLWLISSLATLWWMRTVFKRYETTQALPIEYGAVMVTNALNGLVFYNERNYMETWQIVLMLAGVFVILIGLMYGLRETQQSMIVKKKPSKNLCVKFSNELKIPESVGKTTPKSANQPSQSVEVPMDSNYSRTDTYDDDELVATEDCHNSRRRSVQESLRKYSSVAGIDLPAERSKDEQENPLVISIN